jgi:hypothetical protein
MDRKETFFMKSPPYREGQGIIEYLLLIIIVVLLVLIISKLFGPAISIFIQEILENV